VISPSIPLPETGKSTIEGFMNILLGSTPELDALLNNILSEELALAVGTEDTIVGISISHQ
jgi:hypothetical protein